MDLVQLKIQKFETALISFEAVMEKDLSDEFFRDSAIQRFEYTIELFWKMLKVILNQSFDVTAKSPRETIKEACGVDLLRDFEAVVILRMLKIRNETSHDYAINIAQMLAPELPAFAKLLRTVFERVRK